MRLVLLQHSGTYAGGLMPRLNPTERLSCPPQDVELGLTKGNNTSRLEPHHGKERRNRHQSPLFPQVFLVSISLFFAGRISFLFS